MTCRSMEALLIASMLTLAACGSESETASSPGHDGAGGSGVLPNSPGAGASGGTAHKGGAAGATGEQCYDGFDNDGDGKVDEGCHCTGKPQSCYPGKPSEVGHGRCKAGTQPCVMQGEFGTWGACTGAVLPDPHGEVCNGIDDDCDGVVDNGCECIAGTEETCGSATPPCQPGKKKCLSDGKWGPCEGGVAPKPEVCNAWDDDCNGVVDDPCECVPGSIKKCGTDLGLCEFGDMFCQADGTWSDCLGGIGTAVEVCNGVDDDCDGQVDEGLASCLCTPGAQQPCGLQIGECKPGFQICQGGSAWSECIGATPPGQEVCNGKDDDCDGLVDPGCQCIMGQTQPCGSSVGACKPGSFVCQANGTWSGCQGAIGPQPEICGNGIDEDCNGVVDDGCPTTVTVNLDIDGDCVTASCPPEAPFPIGCNINFQGGDKRGCVAHVPGSPVVYFQEGNVCNAGHLSGTMTCSSQPGPALDQNNCSINKAQKYYETNPSSCPQPD